MRTTLNIDDDVLQAAKELAQRAGKTAGQVLSSLARSALASPTAEAPEAAQDEFLGFRPFPRRGGVVTNDLVNRLRDDGAY